MKYHKSFLITLGHNSSVIYFGGNGAKPIGYEEERLSKKKSDSSYPKLAFERILSQLNREEIQESNVFISHWFDDFNIENYPSKYFDHDHFNTVVNAYQLDVIPVINQFTHHDAHAYSTLAFAENYPCWIDGKIHYIVVDGFGNNQEVISIYEQIEGAQTTLNPIKKVYGYGNSLGLLYQYATSFTGMKENQDEYKFLGYESNIKNVLDADKIEGLQLRAYNWSIAFMKLCLCENTRKPELDYESNIIGIDLDCLQEVKNDMYSNFEDILRDFKVDATNTDYVRTVIGFYVQAVLEQSLLRIISKYQMKNVFLSGGCFLNVKLNKVILDNITGHVCINPLAGDQGAAIGLFRKYTNQLFNFDDLCFGVRDKHVITEEDKLILAEENILAFNTDESFVNGVVAMLETNAIVNVIQGDMEFGPRALCNTSTLAKPTIENTQYINMVNNRNEVMPMAPVMLSDSANMLLNSKDLDRVIGSNKFMIITHDFRQSEPRFRGILHSKPLKGDFTCRPQIIDFDANTNIRRILTESNSHCLINTSFNTHGNPILFSLDDAIQDFRKQRERDTEDRLVLVILNK